MAIVRTVALSKYYGKTKAVDDFSMTVEQGELYGFVGRNGAGKSTVLKMLSGLAKPTSGNIDLFGKPQSERLEKHLIGALIESPGLYPGLSAYDNMMLKCLCVGVINPRKTSKELLDFVGLGNTGRKKTSKFSMGMKQRLGLALALVGDPDLLLLDEPLNGLDPEGVREIRQLLRELNEKRELTVIISSHVLEQLGKIVGRYGIIRDGHMVRELSAKEVEQECSDYLHLEVDNPERALVSLEERLKDVRLRLMHDRSIQISGFTDTQLIGSVLNEAGITIRALYAHRCDLEEYFLSMMGGSSHG